MNGNEQAAARHNWRPPSFEIEAELKLAGMLSATSAFLVSPRQPPNPLRRDAISMRRGSRGFLAVAKIICLAGCGCQELLLLPATSPIVGRRTDDAILLPRLQDWSADFFAPRGTSCEARRVDETISVYRQWHNRRRHPVPTPGAAASALPQVLARVAILCAREQ
jgi:hypothetical protein